RLVANDRDAFTVGTEERRPDQAAMFQLGGEGGVGGQVPDAHWASGGNGIASVRAEANVMDPAGLSKVRQQWLTGFGIPDLGGLIVAAGNDRQPVGAPAGEQQILRMVENRRNGLAR